MDEYNEYLERINEELLSILTCVGEPFKERMLKPCRELVEAGGKRWRALFCILSYKAAAVSYTSRVDENSAYRLCALAELSHTASLIHDDIEDASLMRRGLPAAHIKYGSDVAINSACYLYFLASSCIENIEDAQLKSKLYSLYVDALREMHYGQAKDIFWHKDASFFPSEEEYIKMCRGKTGALSFLAAAVGALSGGLPDEKLDDLKAAAYDFALGFQIIDDSLNILGGVAGKDAADDLVEGKKSFVVILHLENHPEEREKIMRLFVNTKQNDRAALEEGVSLLTPAALRAKNFASSLIEKSVHEFAGVFEPSSYLDELVKLCMAVRR